ncbi:hypothetical protein GCM10007886_28890 [Methylobacterium gregans]|nr:hypothetical protein GCM10007886_28890 [Methylobacterium gregans]
MTPTICECAASPVMKMMIRMMLFGRTKARVETRFVRFWMTEPALRPQKVRPVSMLWAWPAWAQATRAQAQHRPDASAPIQA